MRRFLLPTLQIAVVLLALGFASDCVAAAQTTPAADSAAPAMPQWLADGIDQYGAVALFFAFIVSGVGLHLSEDLILLPAGWLAAHDWPMFAKFWLWAYLGIVAGDSLWFFMCSIFGTRFLHSRWFKRVLHPRRLLEVKHQIDERGVMVLIAARFIPGTRTPVITMCGLLHMAWWKFLAVEFSCVVVTVPLQMLVGVLGARAAREAGVTDITHQALVGLAFTIAFVVLMYLVHVWWSARKSKVRAPRARARWLKFYQATKRLLPHRPPR